MLVDVILPMCNGSRWICEAVESVLRQTHDDLHLTVIDDRSADDGVERVEALRKANPGRVTLIQNVDKRGAAGSRMLAIESTQGEVIAFIDQDDRWLNHKLEKQLARLDGLPRMDAVHADVLHIDACGEVIPGAADAENSRRSSIDYASLSSQELSRSLFRKLSIRLVSAIVRREAFVEIGGFNHELFGGEDWEFWVRFAMHHRIAHIPQTLHERRIHASNTSSTSAVQRIHGSLEALELVCGSYPSLAPMYRKRRSQLLCRLVSLSSRSGQFAEARQGALRLLREGPYGPKVALSVALGLSGAVGRRMAGGDGRRSQRQDFRSR